jgi:hypothetical protein
MRERLLVSKAPIQRKAIGVNTAYVITNNEEIIFIIIDD